MYFRILAHISEKSDRILMKNLSYKCIFGQESPDYILEVIRIGSVPDSVATEVFLTLRKSFDILALYKSD